jgi:hypothetical protein
MNPGWMGWLGASGESVVAGVSRGSPVPTAAVLQPFDSASDPDREACAEIEEIATTSALDKQQLQLRLREICPKLLWAEVRLADPNQPGRGWQLLARAVAEQEGRFKRSA